MCVPTADETAAPYAGHVPSLHSTERPVRDGSGATVKNLARSHHALTWEPTREPVKVISAEPRRTSPNQRIQAKQQPFLFARLAVREIIRESLWLTASDAELDDLLGHGHAGIFGRAVTRYETTAPRIAALLRALAYAFGNGFPRNDGIWAEAGTALYGSPLDDRDIERALNDAASYIMKDSEYQQTTYRLAQRTFVEHYRPVRHD